MSQQIKLGLPGGIEISPPDWPNDQKQRDIWPGDLSQFAANKGPRRTDLSQFHPFRFDPKINAGGGLIYFDEYAGLSELKASLHLMGVLTDMTEYAAFAASSANPVEDDFLDQLRLISHYTLENGYFAKTKNLRPQSLSLWQAIEAFIVGQRRKWQSTSDLSLVGTRGGDNDSAKETLGFGFMVEDTEWSIYRIWSRSWLVTK
ncbi:MAG TPA: hypothetical protein VFW22_08725 [Pseudolabrys sp.]|nr:hypothetical protein [Pseudolabrys sp.]